MTLKRASVRPALRQAKINDFVQRHGKVSIETLGEKFDSSAETIRRDLTALAEAGQLRKIHGGAKPLSAPMAAAARSVEGVFGARMRRNALAKREIAEKVATLIAPRQTIFMDTGSTTLICAEAMARLKHLTIITNSTRIAATFAEGSGGADIYLLGGRYRGDNAQTVGGTAIADIARYRTDIALLTVGALDASGIMDFSNHEAEVARAMMAASRRTIIAADHSKFDKTAAFHVASLPAIGQLVSDRHPDATLGATLAKAGVDLL
ncbi:MAG: DeoR/GlpR family DNA-binding transcription regulator [Rhodobacterales bacterium]|nr:DeoR/GlpR family DNA-binding transcription regulator [Rhodobacterales bacterium]